MPIRYDMPEEEYFAHPAQSKSKLSLLGKDICYTRWLMGYKGSTSSMSFGSLVHAAVLEPETFEDRYKVGPEGDRRTKAVKQAWADFTEANPDVEVVTQADMDGALMARDNVLEHPVASELLHGGRSEVSFFWTDEKTGIECKGRADYLNASQGILVDLKTSRDGSENGFSKACAMFKYHVQQAMYQYGLAENMVGVGDFVFVVVENFYPYLVSTYRLDEESVNRGHFQMCDWLDAVHAYRQAEEEGRSIWTGYPLETKTLTVPRWA